MPHTLLLALTNLYKTELRFSQTDTLCACQKQPLPPLQQCSFITDIQFEAEPFEPAACRLLFACNAASHITRHTLAPPSTKHAVTA